MVVFVPKLSEAYIIMLFTREVISGMFSIQNSRVKFIVLFVPKLSGPGVYIIMLFTQKIIGGMFLTTFIPMSKVVAVFVHELSALQYVCYHAINTYFTVGIFTKSYHGVLHKLSGQWFVCYHGIYTKVICGVH